MRRSREERDCGGAGVELIDYKASLLQYPPLSDYPVSENTEITIGDMHGNALKLLYFLIRENIFLVDVSDYDLFVDIFNKDVSVLTANDIDRFHSMADRIQCAKLPKKVKVRLEGDEVSDRRGNDYWTLVFLLKLTQSNATLEIIFSNHGYEFLQVFEQGLETHYSYMEEAGCANSLKNLRLLLEHGLITMKRVDYLVKSAYLPYLRLLSYTDVIITRGFLQRIAASFSASSNTLPERGVVLNSHACVGFKTITALRRHSVFRSAFKCRARYTPADYVEIVNKRFGEIVMQGAVAKMFAKELAKKGRLDLNKIPFSYAVLRCLWSRGYEKEAPVKIVTSHGLRYHFFYVHGHDSNGVVPHAHRSNVVNLDNKFGKSVGRDDQEKYSVLYTQSI